ncbi:MAG: ATP-dependent DNA helicase, partial [Propionibacteriaceae bacterium]|nr:ATP-dependent DNA helicase [Propionibacteriaceae bacterium]
MTGELWGRVLDRAVSDIGGQPRPGQSEMAQAVWAAFRGDGHLMVQAGTGTGKSLGYLAPAMAWLAEDRDARVVVATATLALQAQLADKDIPAVAQAVEAVTGRAVGSAVLKGRSNYACLYRVRRVGEEQEELSFGTGRSSSVGEEVVELRSWAEGQADAGQLGDRDDAPTHGPLAWGQVSVSAAECLSQTCPFFGECLAEEARSRARASQLVVTNHALLAMDAIGERGLLGDFGGLVVDEAHELASRVTSATSSQLSWQGLARLARQCAPFLADGSLVGDLEEAAGQLEQALEAAEPTRVEDPESDVGLALSRVRDLSRELVSALGAGDDNPDQKLAAGAAREVFEVSDAMAQMDAANVVWVSERERQGRQLVCAPLDVSGLMRELVFSQAPAVLTSATLKIGGEFDAVARQVGLDGDCRAIDVGSPFDYGKQGILYVAKDLPKPGRDGIAPETLAEVAELVWAAGGRTLGLFASQRAAEAAAAHCRAEVPGHRILCQGEAQLSELTRQFSQDPTTCLFGTLSLWQGIDVPGETCQLVVIDKIPFPRPDDPLLQA